MNRRHTSLFVWATATTLALLCSATAQTCSDYCLEGETEAGAGSEALCLTEPSPCMMAYRVDVTLCDDGAKRAQRLRYSIGNTVLIDVDDTLAWLTISCSPTRFRVEATDVDDEEGLFARQYWSLAPFGCPGLYESFHADNHTAGMLGITTTTHEYGQVAGNAAPGNSIAHDHAVCTGAATATSSSTPTHSVSVSVTPSQTPPTSASARPSRARVTATPSSSAGANPLAMALISENSGSSTGSASAAAAVCIFSLQILLVVQLLL